ncbi:MAG TPA: hypothetical protein VEC14_03300 [Reyranellaceae bacterium]|nr:hypothetical protein [Reyranellaceae bacterium]
MAGATNSDFSRALEALTISTLWRAAGLPGPIPTKDGIVKSPFREERTGSFSIGGGGKVWKDHGSGASGGLKDFARLAWPNLSDDDLRERIIEASGVLRNAAPGRRPDQDGVAIAAGVAGAAAPVDPRLIKAARTIERNAAARRAEQAIYDEREAELRPTMPEGRAFIPGWPECVSERYAEGWEHMRTDRKVVEALAAARGWPVAWADEIHARELVSYAWERWSTAGERWARRQKAFRVDYPLFVGVGPALQVTLQPVGYHQRFFTPARGDKPERKGWIYVPSFPKEQARSELERAILEVGRERGLKSDPKTGERDQFIPPLPFVMGELERPRVVVLLEGQWDAITFFGACGWFHDTATPPPVAVFGIRGAQGMEPFLLYWRRWLHQHAPLAWLIADNDAAGGTWRDAPAAETGQLAPPSLAEKLKAAGCSDVKVSWLKPGPWGKDFNDYYRAATPSPEKMYRWMDRIGVLAAVGGGR